MSEAALPIELSNAQKYGQLGHRAAYLFESHDSKSIVVYGEIGEFTILDLDLNIRSTWTPSEAQQVVKLFVFPRKTCRFVPNPTPSNASIVVTFYRSNAQLLMRIDAFDNYVRIAVVESCEIPLANAEDIIDVSCDASGYASVLGE